MLKRIANFFHSFEAGRKGLSGGDIGDVVKLIKYLDNCDLV
jgi:hypothetical protein